jgi:hypothetical protein
MTPILVARPYPLILREDHTVVSAGQADNLFYDHNRHNTCLRVRSAMRTQQLVNLVVISSVVGFAFGAVDKPFFGEGALHALLGLGLAFGLILLSMWIFEGEYSDKVCEILEAKRDKSLLRLWTMVLTVIALFSAVYLNVTEAFAVALIGFIASANISNWHNQLSVKDVIRSCFPHRALAGPLFGALVSAALACVAYKFAQHKDAGILLNLPFIVILIAVFLVAIVEGKGLLSLIVRYTKSLCRNLAQTLSLKSITVVLGLLVLSVFTTGCGASLVPTSEVTRLSEQAFSCIKVEQIAGKSVQFVGQWGDSSIEVTGDDAKKVALKGQTCSATHLLVPVEEVKCGGIVRIIGGRCVIK